MLSRPNGLRPYRPLPLVLEVPPPANTVGVATGGTVVVVQIIARLVGIGGKYLCIGGRTFVFNYQPLLK